MAKLKMSKVGTMLMNVKGQLESDNNITPLSHLLDLMPFVLSL